MCREDYGGAIWEILLGKIKKLPSIKMICLCLKGPRFHMIFRGFSGMDIKVAHCICFFPCMWLYLYCILGITYLIGVFHTNLKLLHDKV